MLANINGIQLAYSDEGAGSPLLFVHGFPFNRSVWSKQIDAFKGSHRVLAPDLRGFGETAATEGPIPMSLLAQDLYALLQHAKTGPVTLIAHSMGGYVALAFAKAYPKALQGLVLVGTKAGADFPEAAAARLETAELVRNKGTSVLLDALAPKMLSARNHDPARASAVRNLMAAASPKGVVAALLSLAARPDEEAGLADLRVPTLVITGLDDVITPAHESETLVSGIQGAQLKLIPKAGHLVAFEQADVFNDTLRAWLK